MKQYFQWPHRSMIRTLATVSLSAVVLAHGHRSFLTGGAAMARSQPIAHLSETLLLAKPTVVIEAIQRRNISHTPAQPGRRFSVTVFPNTPMYQQLDGEIRELSSGIEFVLTVLPSSSPTGSTSEAQIYEAKLDAALFETFWANLQQLGVSELTDATANGPVPGEPGLLQHVSDAPTYQFSVQAQEPVLSHQFQVYGPRHIADSRYQDLVTLFDELLADTFGNQPFRPQY